MTCGCQDAAVRRHEIPQTCRRWCGPSTRLSCLSHHRRWLDTQRHLLSICLGLLSHKRPVVTGSLETFGPRVTCFFRHTHPEAYHDYFIKDEVNSLVEFAARRRRLQPVLFFTLLRRGRVRRSRCAPFQHVPWNTRPHVFRKSLSCLPKKSFQTNQRVP